MVRRRPRRDGRGLIRVGRVVGRIRDRCARRRLGWRHRRVDRERRLERTGLRRWRDRRCTPEECGYTCKTQPDGSEICEAPGEDPSAPVTTVPCEGGPAVDCARRRRPSSACSPREAPTTDEDKVAQQIDPATGSFCPYPCDMPLTDEATTTTSLVGERPAIGVAPREPYPEPEPEPVTIVLTGVEPILLFVGGWDGTDAYLVPGYLFSADDGSTVAVPAIPDDLIEQPDVPKPMPSGDTEDMRIDDGLAPLGDGEKAEVGRSYYVDVVLHCGTVTFDGSTWITDTDVSGWNDGTEGGTFTLTSPDEAKFVGDANNDKVAAFTRQPGDPVACE